jgi:hypothetical protein
MEQTGDRQPRGRTPWIVALVVALVFTIELGAGFLAQSDNNNQSIAAAATSSCLPVRVVEGLKGSLPSGDHACVTITDAKAVGCEVSPSPIPGANVWFSSCVSVVSSGPFLPVVAVPSQVSPPSYGPDPTMAPAQDPVVAKLTAWDSYPSACVLVVNGLSPAAAVRRMGGDPAKHIAADTEVGISTAVTAVGQISGSTVLVEDNGFRCNDPAALQRLTRGGVTAVTVYWSVEADTMLSYAVDGEVLTAWNPMDYQIDGTRPHALDKFTARVAQDVECCHWVSGMLAVAAGVTGTVVPYNWKPSYWVRIPNP